MVTLPDKVNDFIKIIFFNLESNFDQATQKIKKAILYGKINFNDANYCDINMMSKFKSPSLCSKNPVIYYKFERQMSDEKLGNFYLGNETSDINLGHISVPVSTSFQRWKTRSFLIIILIIT